MIHASTFLSHSSRDAVLVAAVGHELGRRGVLAWLDKNELQAGAGLSQALQEAIRRHATVSVFLSPAAVTSHWVADELAAALSRKNSAGREAHIIPVYLGDPKELVSSHDELKHRWLHPDGRVDHQGILVQPDDDPALLAKKIADELANSVYQTLDIQDQREVIIYLDQRGNGRRRGEPQDLRRIAGKQWAPVLVFRPDLGRRSQDETLYGDAWRELAGTMLNALEDAIGMLRSPRKIYILGAAQLGLPFLLGRHFNRNTAVELHCINMDGTIFSNAGQPRHTPLTGGNPHCETSHSEIAPIGSDAPLEAVSLLLCTEHYVKPVLQYLEAHPEMPPPVWVQSGYFTDSEQVMTYIKDVVALLTRLGDENRVRVVYLYCGLPFNMVPLLGANLLNVVDNVIFMEYRRDLQNRKPPVSAGEMYAVLPRPDAAIGLAAR